ncbi:MAG: sodium:alanine symporter family protein [Myxococcales bacterium]|nr:sodium:alanine symporter family protein [Myxococcales bacterium]
MSSPAPTSFLAQLEAASNAVVNFVWGLPLAVMLMAAGLYFTLAGGAPLRRLGHAVGILRGKYDDPDDPGEITHFQALSSALSATIGMGNIAGVAIAVSQGGPGAVFWMWIAALFGTATKYFTCTLATMYRKPDEKGVDQGGPMFFIEVGLGPRFKALAIMFAVCGMVGCLPLFQINQLAELMDESHQVPRLATGLASLVFVGAVTLGGITRVGKVASRIVPSMALLYFGAATVIVARNAAAVLPTLALIVRRAFTAGAVKGGAVAVAASEAMRIGVKRAAFSNEAGVGTAPLAHGAAKTKEPVREGLIAMLGPVIDTNIVCTLTALVILVTGVDASGNKGVEITARAFEYGIPGGVGRYLLMVAVLLFALSTMISYSYYSQKCAGYLFGERIGRGYIYAYLASIPIAAMWSTKLAVNVIDTAFAFMAVPTVASALMLSPRVRAAARDYFARMRAVDAKTPER